MAVLDWLEKVQPREEYILILDADMIMRRALDPVRLGVRPGAQPYESGIGIFPPLNPNSNTLAVAQRSRNSSPLSAAPACQPEAQLCQGIAEDACCGGVIFGLPAHRLLFESYANGIMASVRVCQAGRCPASMAT